MKIRKHSALYINGQWVLRCPLCHDIKAEAQDCGQLPEFAFCNCDRNGNKLPVYENFTEDGKSMIRRNTYPKFTGRITMGEYSDIEEIVWIDTPDVMEAARAMRKAGEFILKKSKK